MVTLHLPVRARDFYPDIRTSGLRWRGQETGRVFSVPRLPSTLLRGVQPLDGVGGDAAGDRRLRAVRALSDQTVQMY